jgi:superfamily I DNA and/or RNA helicase
MVVSNKQPMIIPTSDQKKFLQLQIEEHENAFREYLITPMKQHFRQKSAYWGKLWGVDESRSTLIFRFSAGLAPRLNTPMVAFVVNEESVPAYPSDWEFHYKAFREGGKSKASTQMLAVYYLKSNDISFSFLGGAGIESGFFESAQKALSRGEKPSIVFAEPDPPVQYLINLKSFIERHKEDQTLNLDIKKELSDWDPIAFDSSNTKVNHILSALDSSNEVIIQGPPGTGKSHLIGDLVCQLVEERKSVCITSLTNKALMEVAEKPGISSLAKNDQTVFKTNLSAEESKKISGIKKADKLSIGKGQLLLASYYKLSDWYNPENSEAQNAIQPIYDLVVIEEASQCFLATIAAFRRLGRKVLIVGDPLQLPPIVLNEAKAQTIHPQIMLFAKGLESYSPNSKSPSFILTESYRLSTEAAKRTGIFYKKRLQSIQSQLVSIEVESRLKHLIPISKGHKIHYLPLVAEGDQPRNAIDLSIELVLALRQKNPNLEIAVLAPFKRTILAVQEKLGKHLDNFSGITVETIDRIQGLTVDFTIYILALNNPTFALNLNRFNVATSRAKSGTLIITDREFARFKGTDPLVTEFLNQLDLESF